MFVCFPQAVPGEAVPGEEVQKKKHRSSMGHLWKNLKNDFLDPKAAAADLQVVDCMASLVSAP